MARSGLKGFGQSLSEWFVLQWDPPDPCKPPPKQSRQTCVMINSLGPGKHLASGALLFCFFVVLGLELLFVSWLGVVVELFEALSLWHVGSFGILEFRSTAVLPLWLWFGILLGLRDKFLEDLGLRVLGFRVGVCCGRCMLGACTCVAARAAKRKAPCLTDEDESILLYPGTLESGACIVVVVVVGCRL